MACLRWLLVAAWIAAPVATALATPRNFAAGALIIPMDYCYQTAFAPKTLFNPPASYCSYPTRNTYSTDVYGSGVLRAYGLVWRLLERGITVFTIIDPAKKKIDDADFSITMPACGSDCNPVRLNDPAGKLATTFYPDSTIAYRGGPFVIDPAIIDPDPTRNPKGLTDAQRAIEFLKADNLAGAGARFQSVVTHIAQGSFTAPVQKKMVGAPPHLAVLNLADVSGATAGSLKGIWQVYAYLCNSGLNENSNDCSQPCCGTSGGVYPSTQGTVFDEFRAVKDFTSGGLLKKPYGVLVMPHWVAWAGDGTSSPAPTADEDGVYQAAEAFLDQGGRLVANCASIGGLEKAAAWGSGSNSMVRMGAGLLTTRGLWVNGPNYLNWGRQNNEAWGYSAVASPLVQTGDFGLESVYGHVSDFLPNTAAGSFYRLGVQSLITSKSLDGSAADGFDLMALRRKDGDPSKGALIYLGGDDLNPEISGIRLFMNALLFGDYMAPSKELARSSPVIESGKIYQGTYIQPDIAATGYPPVSGHFRRYSQVPNVKVASFGDLSADWDAAEQIPWTRRIDTAIPDGAGGWTQLAFDGSNQSQLGPYVGGKDPATTISNIRAGGLGGIDTSTPAIVPPSKVAGSPSRPTVALVGAADGMLHAFDVTDGQERWAFIPASQLSRIASSGAGVGGSPMVSDVFFQSAWHTIVAITTNGFGGTLEVLDITDTDSPRFLWQGSATSGSYAMGEAKGAAHGAILKDGKRIDAIFVATNNAGTGNGFNLYALAAETGVVLWQFSRAYTNTIPASTMLTPNDIPGVPVVVNKAGDGGLDDKVYFGDLDGYVWEIDATFRDGTPTTPLYTAGPGQPIASSVALFRHSILQHLFVVVATGGTDWVPSSIASFVTAVDADAHAEVAGYHQTLKSGERVYGSPTVAGDDIYLLTSVGAMTGPILSSSVEAGNVRRYAAATGALTSTTAVTKGASEISLAQDGSVYATSGSGLSHLDNSGRNASGLSLRYRPARPFRILAWLDLH